MASIETLGHHYYCSDDGYGSGLYSTADEFLNMCSSCFGEAPALTERDGDYYGADGLRVLERRAGANPWTVTTAVAAETTTDDLCAYLDARGASYSVEHGGALQIERAAAGPLLLVWWDSQDPQREGWAWRFGGDSGSLDSCEELDRLIG